MTPEQALAEARSQKLRPVYLVVGNEHHLVSQVIRALRDATLEGGVVGLNEDQLNANELGIDAALATARTLPMMAKRRFILVRDIEHWEGASGKGAKSTSSPLDRLAEYAKDPAPSSVLVLVSSKLDKRRRLVTQARTDQWLVSCETPSRQQLPAWIMRSVAERGNSITPAAVELLAELAGPELSGIADAVERLCLYVGPEKTIDEDAVGECVIRLRPATVWELLGAVGRRDVGAALTALDRLYDPHDRGMPVQLLGTLAWSTRQLLRFEAALREGLSPPEAAKQAGAPAFKARELAQQVRQLPRGELRSWLLTLNNLDLSLKGGSKRPAKATLEHALIELCRNISAPS